MPEREYDITIAKDGSVELHVKGHKGAELPGSGPRSLKRSWVKSPRSGRRASFMNLRSRRIIALIKGINARDRWGRCSARRRTQRPRRSRSPNCGKGEEP